MRIANTPRYYVPSPWHSDDWLVSQVYQLNWALLGGTVWPAANRAIYVPVSFPADCTLYSISFKAVNGSDNYDLGFYDGAGTRIAASGSTAMSAAGTKTLTLPELRVFAGNQYYGALVLSGTAGVVFSKGPAATAPLIVVGVGQEALGATALPATMTPASPASTLFPFCGGR